MSTSPNKAGNAVIERVKPEFRVPCEANNYVSYDPEYGCIVGHVLGHRSKGEVAAQNKVLLKYDAAIKEKFGDEHFHGEAGYPLALPLRWFMGWS